MKKDPAVYIRHINDCILRIEAYVLEGRAAFFNDHKTQDAVIRNLEVIGQAVKDLGTERLSAEQPSIPWTQAPETFWLTNILALISIWSGISSSKTCLP